jgi:hypothetical protein
MRRGHAKRLVNEFQETEAENEGVHQHSEEAGAPMRKSLIVVLPLVLVAGGLAVAQTPPTATEAFNLRIRCKQMADKKADELAAGNAGNISDRHLMYGVVGILSDIALKHRPQGDQQ